MVYRRLMQRLEHPKPIETPRPVNNFQKFIGENYEVFENLNDAALELKREDQGRRKDPYVDLLASEYLEIAASSPRLSLAVPYGVFRQSIVQLMFDGKEISEGQEHVAFDKFYRFLSPEQFVELENVRARMEETAHEYKEAIGSLKDIRNIVRQDVMEAFVTYLSSSSDNLSHFGSFLTDPNLRSDRECVKQSLLFLAENVQKGKPESFFDQAINLWKENIMNEANDEVLRQYLGSELKRSEESSSNGSAFFAGLRVGIEIGRGTDQEAKENLTEDVIIKYLKNNTWPEVIKAGYKRVLDTKYSSEISSARVALDQYRRVGEKFISNGEVFSQKDHKRRDKIRARKGESVEKKQETETVKEYRIGLLQHSDSSGTNNSKFTANFIDEVALVAYVEKRANKIAPNDLRILEDLKAIVEDLRNNPHGFGTKKLSDQPVFLGSKKYPLREFVPFKRGSSLSLSHELSNSLRVAYILDDKEGTILIEDIDKHGAFDHKLKSGV